MDPGPPGPSGPGGTINVKVKTMRQELGSLSVDIAADAPVSTLKERLAPLSSIPVPQQRLIFKGRVLRDEQKLNEAGVEAGNTLHLVERPPDAMQQDGPQPSGAAQPGQVHVGAGGMPDLGQFLQGMLASLGAPMPGAPMPGAPMPGPAAGPGQAAPGANAPRAEPLNLLGAVDAYMRQLQEGGSEAVAPILVTSLAPRNIEGLRVLHGSLTAAVRRILEGVQLSPELQAMLEEATAHPDRLAAADASTGSSAPGGAGSQPAAGHRPSIASDPALQARLAQQSYPYMPLALAALRELLRRTQEHLGGTLGSALDSAVDGLGAVNTLGASNRQEVEGHLRTLAGVLHGSAALLTELSRGTAAAMHAVNGNTAALAANAASVLDPMAGPQPVFPRLLPRSNMPLDVLLPMGINLPLGINPLTGAGIPTSQPGPQQPGGAAATGQGAQEGAAADAAAASTAGMAAAGQDLGANVFAALSQQLPGLFGGMQPGDAQPMSMAGSGAAQFTVWPTATIETVQIDIPSGGPGGMGGLAEMLSMFGGAAGGIPMPVDGVPVAPQQEQPSGPMAHHVASAVMRSLGPMVVTIANQAVASASRAAPAAAGPAAGGPAAAAASGGAAGATGPGAAAAGGTADAHTFNNAMSSAIARMAAVLSANADRVQQELQQVERESAAGAPLGPVIGGVIQRTLTTLLQGAAQAPGAAGPAANTAGQPAGVPAATPAATPPAQPRPSAPAAAGAAAAASTAAAGASSSSGGASQQPRGLGGGLRPTLPAKRKAPPAAAAAAAADDAAPSTSAGAGAAASGGLSPPRQRIAPVQTSGDGKASSGSSAPGSPGSDRRKSLTRTPTPGLLRLTESGRSTPRGELHPLREFPDEALNSMAEAAGERSTRATATAPASQARQAAARPTGAAGAAGAAPDLSGLLQMLGGMSAPQQSRAAGAAVSAPATASAPAAAQAPPAAGTVSAAGAGAGAPPDLSGLMQMMGGLMGGGAAGGAGGRAAGAGAGGAGAGGMGGLMQMAAQVASDPNMQPMLNNMASTLFGGGGGAGGGAGGLGSLLSGLLGAPPPGSSAGPSTLVASMDALDSELSPSEAAAWKAMLEADEAAQADVGPPPPLSEVYQAGAPIKSRSLMSVLGGEGAAPSGNGQNTGSTQA